MSSLRRNVLANFTGNAWAAALGIIFPPIFLNFLGIESFGLIGVFTSLQAFLILFNLGISPTFNREIARLSISGTGTQEIADLKRTLEIPNAILSLIVLAVFSALAPLIANLWVQPKLLSNETVSLSFFIMSFSIAAQFCVGFYSAGLLGLQKQVALNIINFVSATVRYVGALAVLIFLSNTIVAFLAWQFVATLLQLTLTLILLRKHTLFREVSGKFRSEILRNLGRFAAGLTATGVLSIMLTQTDKVILSKMLSLEDFGYYSLSLSLSSAAIGMITGSISNVVVPKLNQLVAQRNESALSEFYHHACQMMSWLLIPIVTVLSMFSFEVMRTWTGKESVAENTSSLVLLLSIGTGLNGLMIIPYQLQLAFGWVRLGLMLLFVSLFTLVPMIIFGAYYRGAEGGAVGWLIYNGVYGFAMIWIMHTRLLKNEKWNWYLKDIAAPIIVCLVVSFIIKQLVHFDESRVESLVKLGLITLFLFFVSGLSLKSVRIIVRQQSQNFFAINRGSNG